MKKCFTESALKNWGSWAQRHMPRRMENSMSAWATQRDQMSDLKVPVTSKAVEDWRAGSALRVQTALAEDRKGSVPRTH